MGKDDHYRKYLLVIRLSALGDVAILEPVLRLRAEANPDVLFLLAAPDLLQPLFAGIDNLRFIPTSKKQSSWALFKHFKRLLPQQVADMHHVNRVIVSDWLLRLTGIPVVSIRKHGGSRKPVWRRYDEVFDRCDLRPGKSMPLLMNSPSLPSRGLCYWQPKSVAGQEVRIGIAPFAQHAGKIWPVEKMEQLVSMLSTRDNCRIFLFGSMQEAQFLNAWTERYPQVELVAGKYSFAEEYHLIKTLHVMVSMDSANMHFASCVGVPVVSIWGATHPSRGFYGWRQNPDFAVQADLPCRPCSRYGNKPCKRGNYPCLASISPEQVLKKINNALGGSD